MEGDDTILSFHVSGFLILSASSIFLFLIELIGVPYIGPEFSLSYATSFNPFSKWETYSTVPLMYSLSNYVISVGSTQNRTSNKRPEET